MLIRECRAKLRALDGTPLGPVGAFEAPLHLVRAASLVRQGEAETWRWTLETARAAGRAD
eukprot:2924905-Prymnesium_polylepis.1